eukprot:TRINITY_DN93396_c0_g1_i1.p1 TRINITY_DN93396_c0_g1~~TRINITY_DN93396_c0_g1_i1.p1  ORF type:complete len:375 (-),score=59.88 TRINITY_DN93396_c0_g1_i1:281-1405(-)
MAFVAAVAESMTATHAPLATSESEAPPPMRLDGPSLSARIGRTAALLAGGLAVGFGGHLLTKQHRLRPPTAPVTSGVELFGPILGDDGIYPPGFKIGANNICGAARCAENDLCCPGTFGYGNACGATNAVCCPGRRGSLVCAQGGTCCRNRYRSAYCCAAGNLCSADVCVAAPGQCFPGDVKVQVRGRGAVNMRSVAAGEHVLVEAAPGLFRFEPLLGFLHGVDSMQEQPETYIAIGHSAGRLRASHKHLVFVLDGEAGTSRTSKKAADIEVGDCLVVGKAKLEVVCSRVYSVEEEQGTSGMYAPFTASGNIVVDSVIASDFATCKDLHVPHSSMQAAMFVARLWTKFVDDHLSPIAADLPIQDIRLLMKYMTK